MFKVGDKVKIKGIPSYTPDKLVGESGCIVRVSGKVILPYAVLFDHLEEGMVVRDGVVTSDLIRLRDSDKQKHWWFYADELELDKEEEAICLK